MKNIHYIYTLLFGVSVLLFFGLAYPHHLHYQEQFQLFLFDGNYAWDIVRLPGGIADLLGRFCTQFFLYAWSGAFIIALLLSIVQLLTLRLAGWGRFYGLSFVPSFLLWLYLLDENALLGGVWAVLLTLLTSWVFDKLSGKLRDVLLVVAVPVLYWVAGPISVLFLLLQALRFKSHKLYYGVFVLFAIMLVVLAYYIPVPASSLWFGIHYHRYPTVFPILLWVAALSVFVLALLMSIPSANTQHPTPNTLTSTPSTLTSNPSTLTSNPSTLTSNPSTLTSNLSTLTSFAIVAVCMGCFVWKNANFKAEKIMGYDFMACHQQWNRIIETINAEKPNNQIGVTVQNLALAMRGMLANHGGEYSQNGIAGLLPDVDRDATSPMPTAEAFYQLGMINVAQRTVFEAQEAILDFQKSARCYKRLAQTNLINGDYEVARKYLHALQKTLFYSDWANETLALLGNEKAIANHPEYGHLRKFAYNEDFYFSDHVTPEMLESLYYKNRDNRLAYEYLIAYYMLTGDRDRYARFLQTINKQ